LGNEPTRNRPYLLSFGKCHPENERTKTLAYSENMQRRPLLLAVLFIAAGLLLVSRSHSQDQLDSLIACRQTQKLIFENTFVRVIDDVIPPGVSEPKHRHPHGVVIAVEDGDTESRSYPEGKAVRRHTSKGTASWNEAIVHDVKNVGKTPTHFIRIDVKQP
jgi:predicted metal-dependent enzyme (double-stranded beta helix superfamily)